MKPCEGRLRKLRSGMTNERKACPCDVTDEKRVFCVPYLTLMKEATPQHEFELNSLFANSACQALVKT